MDETNVPFSFSIFCTLAVKKIHSLDTKIWYGYHIQYIIKRKIQKIQYSTIFFVGIRIFIKGTNETFFTKKTQKNSFDII